MSDLSSGTKLCTNCKQQINAANFLMHEGFCLRNIVLCNLCQKPYDKNQKEDHIEEFHAKVACECGELIEKMHLDAHKLETCKKRQAQCFYCDLSLDFDKFQEHLNFCGSRTELCSLCSRYIQLKDKSKHETSNCKYPEVVKAPKQESASKLPNRTTSFDTIPNFYSNQRVLQPSTSFSSFNTNKNKREQTDREKSFTMLPCEFCSEFYTSDTLIEHQNSCSYNPSQSLNNFGISESLAPRTFLYNNIRNMNLADDNIDPMEFFDEDTSSITNDYYANILRNNSASNLVQKNNNNSNKDDDADKIPCEFCNKLFDFDSIFVHQTICDKSLNTLDGVSASRQPDAPKRSAFQTVTSSTSKTSLNNADAILKRDPLKYRIVREKDNDNEGPSRASGGILKPSGNTIEQKPKAMLSTRSGSTTSASKAYQPSIASILKPSTTSIVPIQPNSNSLASRRTSKPEIVNVVSRTNSNTRPSLVKKQDKGGLDKKV